MNWNDWYTDTMDIWRTVSTKDGSLTRMERQQVLTGIPCRIYTTQPKGPAMSQTAASITQTEKLACALTVDLRAGDELHVHRGGRLGKSFRESRYFAGEPQLYPEPFGAVLPGLAHQEITLLKQERVK